MNKVRIVGTVLLIVLVLFRDISPTKTHSACAFRANSWIGKDGEPFLVGDFDPSEKYARQIGSSPQVGIKKKKCFPVSRLRAG